MDNHEKLQDYFNRSGDSELSDGIFIDGGDNGFCIYRVTDKKLILINVYGNGKFWNKWAEDKARELNLKTILFATKRNPKGFHRKYNYNIVGYILERDL